MPNRLAGETSPYLLQHKDNPVDWYPWGPSALASAKLQDKPILLSIGYSACHWCHVMAHESFENPEIASLMNRLFVNIKVDREERPDIDAIYMAAVQTMTGQGGWPLTVFLTPEGRPFYGGTYFPPEDRRGLAGLPKVLQAVAEAYRTRRGELLSSSSQVIGSIQAQATPRKSSQPLDKDVLGIAFLKLASQFDEAEGGLGVQPKFPQPLTWEFLLRYWKSTTSAQARDMVMVTLQKMALGGMYDQIGGGFHRYSTDTYWLVPHFEKMLYDNALLATLYLHGWQAVRDPNHKRVVDETLSWVLAEMSDPGGGFYSAQDADSEGVEGKYYVWLPAGIDEVLGPELGEIARTYWGVTRDGNFEGQNILSGPEDEAAVARALNISEESLSNAISEARRKLYEARKKRVAPGTDDKVLTAWNALMLKAFAECGAALERPDWINAARRNAGFLLDRLVLNGRLQRTWKATPDGQGVARQNAFLEDYASLVDGLIALYEATFEPRWLNEARRLADEMVKLFWSPADGAFFDTPEDHETLVVRPRDIFDNATPAGNSTATLALLKLSVFTGDQSYSEKAEQSLSTVREFMAEMPTGFANWLAAADFLMARAQEVVVLGPLSDPATKALLSVARREYAPNRILAGADGPVPVASGGLIVPGKPGLAPVAIRSPLLEGRALINGKPTAFVCENYACQMPVTDPADLEKQLAR